MVGCVLLVGWTASTEGEVLATRALTNLVMPMGLCWLGLLVLSIVAWHQRNRLLALLMVCLLVLLTAAGNTRIADAIFHRTELPEPTMSASATDPYDVVIVLGGSVKRSPRGTPELGSDGERVVSAAQAWHAGVTKQIICTGVDPTGLQPQAQFAEVILVSLGVPPEVILQLGGENTTGEMQSLQEHLRDKPAQRIGLITSSFHMRRAMRLANDHGIDVEPIPVAYRVLVDDGFQLRDLVPNGPSAANVAIATKEWIAGFFGR